MASPKIEVIFLYDASTGSPLTGATITFDTYKNDAGTNVSQPSITEIGGGAYKFTPVFADEDRGIVYVANAGSTATPQRVARYMRPEDWITDDIGTLTKYAEGRWKIHTTGMDANRIVFYDTDGTTVFAKFDLKDQDGNAVFGGAFERVPV